MKINQKNERASLHLWTILVNKNFAKIYWSYETDSKALMQHRNTKMIIQSWNENEINTSTTEKEGRDDEMGKEKQKKWVSCITVQVEIKSHGIKWIEAPYVEMLYI